MSLRQTSQLAAGMLAVALFSSGCAWTGYRLGSTLPRNLRTIHIPIVVNESGEPSLEVDVTEAVTEDFQTDGALKVVQSAKGADLLLEIKLTSYKLQPLSYDRDRGKTANEYRIRLKAKILCKNQKANEILVATEVEGKATFVPSGGISLSKREALPDAADDLAHNIVEQIVEAW